MTTKKLYVLICDCGDGSYYPGFTFNEEWIKEQEKKNDEGSLDSSSIGVDGDGFHYTILKVPSDCTLGSLRVSDCSIN